MIHFFSLIPPLCSKLECSGAAVRATSRSISARYSVFIPGSLNCEAIVPYTGSSSSVLANALWLRLYCLRTSRSASSEPRLSNLLIAIASAKSSMSIFSSCVAAPYSAVITYSETSACSVISVSLWPMPEVSTITRSNRAARQISIDSRTCLDSDMFDCRVASDRMYTRGLSIEFIRIRSPSRAPPDLRFDGSTEITAIVLSLKSVRNRRTSSSTSELLPAPPVPVTPSTGTFCDLARIGSSALRRSSPAAGSFSAAVIKPPIVAATRSGRAGTAFAITGVAFSKSHCCRRLLIIPCRPIERPSSGEYSRVTPYAWSS